MCEGGVGSCNEGGMVQNCQYRGRKVEKVEKEGVRWKIDGGERKVWDLNATELKRKHSQNVRERELIQLNDYFAPHTSKPKDLVIPPSAILSVQPHILMKTNGRESGPDV